MLRRVIGKFTEVSEFTTVGTSEMLVNYDTTRHNDPKTDIFNIIYVFRFITLFNGLSGLLCQILGCVMPNVTR